MLNLWFSSGKNWIDLMAEVTQRCSNLECRWTKIFFIHSQTVFMPIQFTIFQGEGPDITSLITMHKFTKFTKCVHATWPWIFETDSWINDAISRLLDTSVRFCIKRNLGRNKAFRILICLLSAGGKFHQQQFPLLFIFLISQWSEISRCDS